MQFPIKNEDFVPSEKNWKSSIWSDFWRSLASTRSESESASRTIHIDGAVALKLVSSVDFEGLLSRATDFGSGHAHSGGLHSGGLLSRATDFGSGHALACS